MKDNIYLRSQHSASDGLNDSWKQMTWRQPMALWNIMIHDGFCHPQCTNEFHGATLCSCGWCKQCMPAIQHQVGRACNIWGGAWRERSNFQSILLRQWQGLSWKKKQEKAGENQTARPGNIRASYSLFPNILILTWINTKIIHEVNELKIEFKWINADINSYWNN